MAAGHFSACPNPDTLGIEPDKWETLLFFLPEGLPPPGPSARADGRAGHPCPDACFDFLDFFGGYTGPGRQYFVFVMKCNVECTQNHVWGFLGARVKSILIKTYIFFCKG